ncbi:MAG: hypothetical protein L3K04_03695 [Thermoplasmata archaeon]|nr:hypothetical protein [Thermoplasmata archaeon]
MYRPLAGLPAATVVLTLIALIGVPGLGGAHAVAPPAIPHPAVAASITPTDSGGFNRFNFETGLSTGQIYYHAYDGTGDTVATVEINDKNATRDGLTNPVAKFVANFTLFTDNYSSDWNIFYALPLNLPQGGIWNITLAGTLAGFLYQNFTVQTFYTEMGPYQEAYLPGQSAQVLSTVTRTTNGAPFTPTTIVVTGTYELANFTFKSLFGSTPLTLTPSGFETFTVSIPRLAAPGTSVLLRGWANLTGTGGTESHTSSATLYVGNLSTALSLTLGNGGTSVAVLPANTPAILTVAVTIITGFYTGPGANISVALALHGPHGMVTSLPGNPPLHLITNSQGDASILFTSSTSTFTPQMPYVFWENSTQTNGPGASLNNTLSFSVLPYENSTEGLQVWFGQQQYYGGDTATVNWQLGNGTGGAPAGWTVDDWEAVEPDASYAGWLTGTINSGAGSSSFTLPMPTGYAGLIELIVFAHNATQRIDGVGYADVTTPSILLTPSEYVYQPGDTLHVAVGTQGSALSSATLWGTVASSSGVTLWSGVVTGGSISFNVPVVNTPSYVRVNVTAQSPTSGLLASGEVTIDEGNGYVLHASISTKSNYVDGSYQPGQTITIQYTIVPVSNAPAPGVISLYFETDQYVANQGSSFTQTTATSGSVSFKIPSSWGTGDQYVDLYAEFQHCPTGGCSAYDELVVPVEASPSVLTNELGAGSGLTVGWVIQLVLIVVVALVLFLLIRRRSSPPAGGPIQPYSADSGTAKDGAAGSSGTSVWSEGSGTKPDPASNNPPLPTPASGDSPH